VRIVPLERPPDATVTVPGSKSITNRALMAAALASGTSRLRGALFADDTEAMVDCVRRLGGAVVADETAAVLEVHGLGGRIAPGPVELDARQSGTTARFVLPVLATGKGRYVLDGSDQLRARPMGPLVTALRSLGATVVDGDVAGHLPLTVDADGLAGGAVAMRGDVSSQFISALLLIAPAMHDGLRLELTSPLVSAPYAVMTARTMAAFGVDVEVTAGGAYAVGPGTYRATDVDIEPDASTASYFFAAAAITGGRVRVAGLGRASAQGDVAFVDVLAQMGARVSKEDGYVEVSGTGEVRGVDVDLGAMSDTAPTLAAIAPFASSPTTVRGIGFIRRKETDRIAAVVRELQRCGVDAREMPDGFVVQPGLPHAARIETYDDHRMAMSFALIGLRVAGIEIAGPDCVAKTFPGYFDALEQLRRRESAN
jgi:3-phosphoshikimate 1-carboxyvinyltransferase